MLFEISYKVRTGGNESSDKRIMQIFSKWKPPAGMVVKAHYARTMASGFIIAEADSVAPIIEANAVYAIWLDYEVTPIIDIADAVPALERAYAWRESIR